MIVTGDKSKSFIRKYKLKLVETRKSRGRKTSVSYPYNPFCIVQLFVTNSKGIEINYGWKQDDKQVIHSCGILKKST